jgi:Na+(H+)/acetate symporter ActP
MSGLFVCSILGRFWLRFNWQGALTALLSGMLVSIVVLVKPTGWLTGAIRAFRRSSAASFPPFLSPS